MYDIDEKCLVGGYTRDSSPAVLDTTELVTFSPPMANRGPVTLPERISQHCVVLVDDKIFIIGGSWSNSASRKVLSISIHDGGMSYLTSMNVSRTKHGCGSFKSGDNTYIVVAGGNTNTSEILNVNDNVWFQG